MGLPYLSKFWSRKPKATTDVTLQDSTWNEYYSYRFWLRLRLRKAVCYNVERGNIQYMQRRMKHHSFCDNSSTFFNREYSGEITVKFDNYDAFSESDSFGHSKYLSATWKSLYFIR